MESKYDFRLYSDSMCMRHLGRHLGGEFWNIWQGNLPKVWCSRDEKKTSQLVRPAVRHFAVKSHWSRIFSKVIFAFLSKCWYHEFQMATKYKLRMWLFFFQEKFFPNVRGKKKESGPPNFHGQIADDMHFVHFISSPIFFRLPHQDNYFEIENFKSASTLKKKDCQP